VSGNRERAAYHVSIEADAGHLYRGHYRERADLALECIVTMCLAGPAAEELFCGPIEDGSDRADYEMAKHYLARRFGPLHLAAEIARLRDAARRLVRTAWAQHRIRLIAEALLQRGTLTGDEIGRRRYLDAASRRRGLSRTW
jgi:plasmid stabilization system protein ParE